MARPAALDTFKIVLPVVVADAVVWSTMDGLVAPPPINWPMVTVGRLTPPTYGAAGAPAPLMSSVPVWRIVVVLAAAGMPRMFAFAPAALRMPSLITRLPVKTFAAPLRINVPEPDFVTAVFVLFRMFAATVKAFVPAAAEPPV